jgi:hypothetical protein
MVFPAVKLHQLYSLNLYNGLDVLFEELTLLDLPELEKIAMTKELGACIPLVNQRFEINTHDKIVRIMGHKINNTTYIVNRQGNGIEFVFKYTCSDADILTGIEYLYHMYKNLV